MIAQRSFSTTKSENTIAMSRKRQRDEGRFEAMQYFEKEGKMNKLTWSVILFDNVEGGGDEGGECDGAASSHLDNK